MWTDHSIPFYRRFLKDIGQSSIPLFLFVWMFGILTGKQIPRQSTLGFILMSQISDSQ